MNPPLEAADRAVLAAIGDGRDEPVALGLRPGELTRAFIAQFPEDLRRYPIETCLDTPKAAACARSAGGRPGVDLCVDANARDHGPGVRADAGNDRTSASRAWRRAANSDDIVMGVGMR